MRITESKLRKIIRQVIVENLENQILDSEGYPFDRDYVQDLMGLVRITGDSEMIIKGLGSLSETELEDFKLDYLNVVKNKDNEVEMKYSPEMRPSYYNKLNNMFVHKGYREIE